MERASTIYLYTSTPPLTCDGRREDKSTHVERQRGSGRPGAAGARQRRGRGSGGGRARQQQTEAGGGGGCEAAESSPEARKNLE
jgi:hypothetical protein